MRALATTAGNLVHEINWLDTSPRERAAALDLIAAMRGVAAAGWRYKRHTLRVIFEADGVQHKTVLESVEVSTSKVS